MKASIKTERLPALATDAELCVLGSIALDPTTVDEVAAMISQEDFHDADLGKVFTALVDLHNAGMPINDPKILLSELPRQGVPAEVNSAGFIARMASSVANAYHAKYHANLVRRAARLRKQTAIAEELYVLSTHPSGDPEDVTAWLNGQLATLDEKSEATLVTLSQAGQQVVDSLEAETPKRILFSGEVAIDEAWGGFAAKELIILAARPSNGKTAFAMQIAVHNASKARNVLFVSLEMSAFELAQREACASCGVDSQLLRIGELNAQDKNRVRGAVQEFAYLPITIWDPPSTTMTRLRAVARRQLAQNKLDLLVVDYLQLIRGEKHEAKAGRVEQVTNISNNMKVLARELNIPILCLAQLNREADKVKPSLAHLRDSGAIEQDADSVAFLHVTVKATRHSHGKTELIIGKNRHGSSGFIELEWRPSSMRFCGDRDVTQMDNYDPELY